MPDIETRLGGRYGEYGIGDWGPARSTDHWVDLHTYTAVTSSAASCQEYVVISTLSDSRLVGLVPADISISPNSTGLPGIGQLRTVVGAAMTVGLILAVLALVIAAVVWALGSNSSNPHLAGRGKLGVLVALGAAIVTGAAVALVNFFWNVGQSI